MSKKIVLFWTVPCIVFVVAWFVLLLDRYRERRATQRRIVQRRMR